jgi:hypothetical protein
MGVQSSVKFTILLGRWIGNTGCPAKSLMKGGHSTHSTGGYFQYLYGLSNIQCRWLSGHLSANQPPSVMSPIPHDQYL